MFEVYAKDYRITIQEIPLGNQGEDMARCLVIDITDAVDEFGSGGTVTVRNKRNGDEMPYMATNVTTVTGADATGRTHTYIKWTLTDVDTAVAGSGFVQADYIIAGVTVKTWVYKYFILPSLGVTGDVPDPYEDILEEITAQVAAVQAAAASAEASAAEAEASATRIISTTQATVEDWLSEHIISGYAVDDTLSIRGAAADAAATGDLKRQIMSAFVTESASGSIASFDDGADDVPVKDLVVNITPVQAGSGDPSPSNVRAISGWTAANIYRTGKNLFNYEHASDTVNGITFTVNPDKTITMNGTATGTATFLYSMSADTARQYAGCILSGNSNGNVQMLLEQINSPYTRYASDSGSGATILDSIGTNGGVNFILRTFSGATLNNVVIKPMIRVASDTDNTYEPYNADSTVYNISFGSAGTVYGGTLDVTSGMLTVDKIAQTISGGMVLYGAYGDYNAQIYYTDIANYIVPYANSLNNAEYKPICNKYLANTANTTMSMLDMQIRTQDTTRQSKRIYVRDSRFSTADAFNADLATTPMVIVGTLPTPVSYQLTPTEVKTLLANNNIWSDTGSVASCEYRTDAKLYLEKLTNPDNDMTADSNIASGSYFMVNNTLYLATAAIASGATITPGTNCTETSLAAALNAINA